MEVKSEIRGAVISGFGGFSAFAVSVQDVILDMAAVDEKVFQMILSDVESVLRGEIGKRMAGKYVEVRQRENCDFLTDEKRVIEV